MPTLQLVLQGGRRRRDEEEGGGEASSRANNTLVSTTHANPKDFTVKIHWDFKKQRASPHTWQPCTAFTWHSSSPHTSACACALLPLRRPPPRKPNRPPVCVWEEEEVWCPLEHMISQVSRCQQRTASKDTRNTSQTTRNPIRGHPHPHPHQHPLWHLRRRPWVCPAQHHSSGSALAPGEPSGAID